MKRMKKQGIFYGITANVILLGLTSLLTDVSGEIITAILPLFLVSLGASAIVIGLVRGLSEAGISIFMVLSGHLSDKKGKRKPFIVFGYTFASFAKLLIAFSTTWPLVLIFRPLERLGKGIRDPPRDALIAETTMRKVHGKVFGVHKVLDNFGALIGAGLAFVFLKFLGLSFNLAIFISAIIAFTALIPLFFVKEQKRKPVKTPLRFGLKKLSKRFKKFLAVITLFSLGNFGYVFLILKANETFGNNTTPLLLYFFFTISYVIFTLPGGLLSDKIGRKKILVIGYSIYALTYLGFALVSSTFTQFVFLFALFGLAKGFVTSNQVAFASDLAEKELGTAIGTFHMLKGLAALPAGLIAGALWVYVSPSATFFYGTLISVAAALLFLTDNKLDKY